MVSQTWIKVLILSFCVLCLQAEEVVKQNTPDEFPQINVADTLTPEQIQNLPKIDLSEGIKTVKVEDLPPSIKDQLEKQSGEPEKIKSKPKKKVFKPKVDVRTTREGIDCDEKSKDGDIMRVHYKGYLLGSSEPFDSSEGKNPIEFELGGGQVIQGWEQGLVGMCVGEERELIIPPELAYGSKGAGDGVIPPNSTLKFIVDLVYHKAGDGLLKINVVKKPKECTKTSQPGDTLAVHFEGIIRETKKVFDSSVTRGETLKFKLGSGQVIRGWDEGLLNMCVGERRELVVPPELGYGVLGAGKAIPPNSILNFRVELMELNKEAETRSEL